MKKIQIPTLIALIQKQLLPKFDDATMCTQYAWWLVESITHKQEIDLISQNDIKWDEQDQKKLDDALDKLINKDMPLSYLLGSTPFCGLDILTRPPVLIPRPETEEWTANLIQLLKSVRVDGALRQAQDKLREWPVRQSFSEGWKTSPLGSFGASIEANGGGDSNEPWWILDLCTGSGCIALALADALPKAKVYGTDIAEHALALAKENARHNHITNVEFLYSDCFDSIPKEFKFDLIVGNPPYIDQKEWPTLDKSVTQWEDKQALIAPDHGLAIIKRIIDAAPSYIKPNELMKKNAIPQLILEMDSNQGKASIDIYETS